MFARFGHMAFNSSQFNESGHDSDSARLKDFIAIGTSAKSVSALAVGAKSFTDISESGGTSFVEVGG